MMFCAALSVYPACKRSCLFIMGRIDEKRIFTYCLLTFNG